MNKHNWPFFTDLGESNWTGRTDRKMRYQTRYTRADEQISVVAWIGGALFLAMVFGYIPLLWVLMV
jgi:hypothetical protein